VSSLKYYDADNASQAVASTNYRLHPSDSAAAYLEIDSEFTRPDHYMRDDAVVLTYLAGYATIGDVPKAIKDAMLLALEMNWGDRSPQEMAAMDKSIRAMLSCYEWGCYR
jgi:hypothetical protein